jgi:hypothetical protein
MGVFKKQPGRMAGIKGEWEQQEEKVSLDKPHM